MVREKGKGRSYRLCGRAKPGLTSGEGLGYNPLPEHRRPKEGDRRSMAQPPTKTWQLLPHDREAVERLAGALRLSPLVAQLLLNRGVEAPEQARRFLEAPLTGLHPPGLLP